MTVNDTGPAVTTDPPEPEPEFDDDIARLAAATLLAKGHPESGQPMPMSLSISAISPAAPTK
jgi:hypothetical protein